MLNLKQFILLIVLISLRQWQAHKHLYSKRPLFETILIYFIETYSYETQIQVFVRTFKLGTTYFRVEHRSPTPHPTSRPFCGSRLKIISACCHLHFLVRSLQNAQGGNYELATTKNKPKYLHSIMPKGNSGIHL